MYGMTPGAKQHALYYIRKLIAIPYLEKGGFSFITPLPDHATPFNHSSNHSSTGYSAYDPTNPSLIGDGKSSNS